MEYPSRELIKDLWRWIRPYKGRFIFGSSLRLSSDIVALYFDIALAQMVNFFASYHIGNSTTEFWKIFVLWILAGLLYLVGHYLAKYHVYKVAERSSLDAGLETIKHFFKLDIAWHHQENTGNKIKRILKAQEGINNIQRIWVNNFIEITVRFVGLIAIMAAFETKLAGLMLIYIFIFLLFVVPLNKKASQASNEVNIEEEYITGSVFEAINNIRTVKVLDLTRALFGQLVQKNIELFKKIDKRIFAFQSRGAATMLCNITFNALGFAMIGMGILHGHYEVGLLVLFYNFFRRIRESVNELADVSQDFVIAKYGIYRMKMILNEPIKIEDTADKRAFPTGWQNIKVKDLSFSYGDKNVLKNISFDIKRGEKIGIVGLSGVGKSTLFKLFLKEYDNFDGEIGFDDLSIKKIRQSDYFKNVAVVLQDTEVFNLSLRDNVMLAGAGDTDARNLQQALAVAHVDDFVEKLPNGLETIIGEKGIKLSGGERQRVGIARAIYKRPEILFLDEATSHLDIESEKKIQDSLHIFFKDVTAIVIAHRLTTIREMDRIIVLEDGGIIEEGSFEDLIAQKGRFFELWEGQKL